jgi:transglutaminase-like putative cysteine protease
MLIRYGYELEFFCPQPVLMVCLLDTHHEAQQQVKWQGAFRSDPPIETEIYRDVHGNDVRRFMSPAGKLTISRDQVFECDGSTDPVIGDAREVPLSEIPSEYLIYLLGSRYCETDKLSNIAWNLFGNVAPGWQRVQAICDFVNNHLTFGYQYARATRTAYEAYEERLGVCRDFAHLAVTLCRCMNIPTRYANGFLGDIGIPPDPAPMDYNAWIEVYLDHKWYIFDARHNVPRIGRITVSRGRDATDIPLATSFGPHFLNLFKVWTDEVGEDVLQDRALQSA